MCSNNEKTRHTWALAVVMIAVCWASSVQCVFGDSYAPCRIPPQIGLSTKPNVLLVMDYSGSMQKPAYYDHTDWNWTYEDSDVFNDYILSTSIINGTYTPNTVYYGLFESNKYYKYDAANGWFMYQDNPDTGLNDPANLGNWTIGIRGNVLNWALTSRMDSAMKALIGGKAYDSNGGDCDDPLENCYIKGEGSRRYLRAATSGIDAEFYIRPADAWTTATAEAPSGYTGRWSNLPNGIGPYPNT